MKEHTEYRVEIWDSHDSRWYFWGSFSTQGMAVLHAKESCTVKGWRVVKQTISSTVVHMN